MDRIDCSTYSSDSCLKGENADFESFTEIIVLACWGVYCQEGDYILPKIKKGEIKAKRVLRGQKSVFDAIRKYARNNEVSDLFFAGDNIYQNAFPFHEVGDDVKGYIESHREEVGFQIERQLESFERCYSGINIERTFVGFGNHDIETCDIFNRQLNFDGWKKLGTYYNVYYHEQKCNMIMIDTNLYDDEAKQCDGKAYEKHDIALQTEFIVEQCKISKERGDWVIIMGHIPYVAIGHKEERPIVYNEKLEKVFLRLEAEKCLPHLYICGDEHNQQLIKSKKLGLPLAVIGSGGTDLDPFYPIERDNEHFSTEYDNSVWGFLSLKIEEEKLVTTFMGATGGGDYRITHKLRITK